MPCHSFEVLHRVEQLFHSGIRLIELPQFRDFLLRLRHFRAHKRNEFGHAVNVGVRHAKHPTHVPDTGARPHGPERDDLRHAITPVLLVHIPDNFVPAVVGKVEIHVRHSHSLRIQETLERQSVPHRINVCNKEAVRNDAGGCTASPRPHGDTLLAGKPNDVVDKQKIVDEPGAEDDGQFILEPSPDLARDFVISTGKSGFTEPAQVLL